MDAKAKGSKSGGGILKLTDGDGRVTKKTNFSKAQWEDEADKHILDVWACDDGRLGLIKADAEGAQRAIITRKFRGKGKGKATGNADTEAKQSRRSSYTARVVSDSDYWYVLWDCRFVFLIYSFRTRFLVEHGPVVLNKSSIICVDFTEL
jgi:hypothetical protein